MTPGLTYRHYRNHVMETIGSIGVAKYFKGSWDSHGYYVVQGSVATSLGGSVRGQSSATVGIQTVRNGGVSLGLSAEFGGLIRDPVAGATTGSYWAVRPSVSVPLLHGFEVFARGEYAETQAFTAAGGSTGLKVEF